MKTAMIAFVSAMLVAPAALASFDDVKQDYDASAFSDADSDWRRLTVNRVGDCGSYGSNNTRRIDVLIDKYQALGDAIQSGNNAAASEAAHDLADTITSTSRYESCWDAIARKKGISRTFKRELLKL